MAFGITGPHADPLVSGRTAGGGINERAFEYPSIPRRRVVLFTIAIFLADCEIISARVALGDAKHPSRCIAYIEFSFGSIAGQNAIAARDGMMPVETGFGRFYRFFRDYLGIIKVMNIVAIGFDYARGAEEVPSSGDSSVLDGT